MMHAGRACILRYWLFLLLLWFSLHHSECVVLLSSGGEKEQATKPSKLLDGSSDFVLTYEDKEGDWMLVGDVPWGYASLVHY